MGLPEKDDLQHFLRRLEDVRQGPLRELEAELQQVKAFHANALRATEKAQEKDALSRVEFLLSAHLPLPKKLAPRCRPSPQRSRNARTEQRREFGSCSCPESPRFFKML